MNSLYLVMMQLMNLNMSRHGQIAIAAASRDIDFSSTGTRP
jgi:hypothetical protein